MQIRQGISVWPGYVAAVASLVLSLLLLSGVMVFAITQVGQLVGSYNEDLMVAVVEDELRAIELEKLQANAKQAEKELAQRARQTKPVVAQAPIHERPASLVDLELLKLERLQAQIDQRERDIEKLNRELTRVQSELRFMAPILQGAQTRVYRFVFGQGVTGLTDAAMSEFIQKLQDDGVSPSGLSWVLEAGVMGLDPVANREVYRLMLNIRKQLELLGFESDRVRVVLNSEARPQSLMGNSSNFSVGDVPILLSTGINAEDV